MKKLFLLFIIALFTGCSGIILEPANFAWPIESVMETNEKGFIQENRYSFSVNVKPLFFAERNDSASFKKESVRVIRGNKGYYYMIASGFKNIYLFSVDNGQMLVKDVIFVSEFGVDLPALNQRNPYIELLEGESTLLFLNSDGIKGKE
ncbi:MAG: hypothetical protein GY936_10625 [Ignavibacteriae bacterium]|nr:hypothetical protein [Ignavibacteriota bacterium]